VLSKKVSAFIKSNSLISPTDHIIVALSGGRDSISLLHLLNSLKEKLKITLSAIHINHGVRGLESDEDEKFVKTICKEIGIECSFYSLNGFNKNTSENKLRKARYEKFETESVKFKRCKIATAHHLDDQLETFLMRLFRGSGPKGLLGIPVKRENYIRPLLACSRKEIDLYCDEKNILFRNDSSNAETDKLRNKIRHHLTPVLGEIFGEDYLSRYSKGNKDFTEFYREYFESNISHFEKQITRDKNQLIVKKLVYKSFYKNQKLHFLEYCFSYIYGLPFTIQSDQMTELEKFVDLAKTGSEFQFSENKKVLKDRSNLIFYIPQNKDEKCWELYEGQNVNCGHSIVSLKKVENNKFELNNNPNIEFINGEKFVFPLKVRFWKKGDFFYPLGKKGKQKLSDFFINQKVSVLDKKKTPLILSGSEIIWVGGYRINELYKVAKTSKNVYKIEIEML